jgi:hypothetical protein
MKIVDMKCAVIGHNPVVRIITDEGFSGYGRLRTQGSISNLISFFTTPI